MLSRHHSNIEKDAATARPRFLQIADDIRGQIARNELKAHDILPSERNLSEDFCVSRMTGRRALEALEAEGLVYSSDRRGRFVSPQRLSYNISNIVSFVSNAQARKIALRIEVIDTVETTMDSKLAACLGQLEGCNVTAYTRLFYVGDHPTFIETEHLIADRFPGFLRHDLRQSTTQILETQYQTRAETGDIVIRMRGVQAQEAELLGISASNTIIELEQVIRDANGIPFCLGRQIWRGEMAEFSAHAIVTHR